MASEKRHGQERAGVIYTNLCCLATYKHSLTCVCNDTQLRNYIEITRSYLWVRFFGSPKKEKRENGRDLRRNRLREQERRNEESPLSDGEGKLPSLPSPIRTEGMDG